MSRREPALKLSASRDKAPQPSKRLRVGMSRFRLLPLTIMMAVLLLTVKTTQIYTNSRELDRLLNQDAVAQEEINGGGESTEAKPEDGEEKAEGESTETVKPAEGTEGDKTAAAPEAKEGEAKPGDVKLANLGAPISAQPERKQEFTQIELDILQSLAERRKELEDRMREVDLKEKLLEATEIRVNDKLGEMKSLKTQVDGLLKEYSMIEDKKVDGLVKIYETMKPKDAAQIFNELDMPIMLTVVDRMSSRKVAPILAGMEPERARELTIELAEYRRLKALPQTVSAEQSAAETAAGKVQ